MVGLYVSRINQKTRKLREKRKEANFTDFFVLTIEAAQKAKNRKIRAFGAANEGEGAAYLDNALKNSTLFP